MRVDFIITATRCVRNHKWLDRGLVCRPYTCYGGSGYKTNGLLLGRGGFVCSHKNVYSVCQFDEGMYLIFKCGAHVCNGETDKQRGYLQSSV